MVRPAMSSNSNRVHMSDRRPPLIHTRNDSISRLFDFSFDRATTAQQVSDRNELGAVPSDDSSGHQE